MQALNGFFDEAVCWQLPLEVLCGDAGKKFVHDEGIEERHIPKGMAGQGLMVPPQLSPHAPAEQWEPDAEDDQAWEEFEASQVMQKQWEQVEAWEQEQVDQLWEEEEEEEEQEEVTEELIDLEDEADAQQWVSHVDASEAAQATEATEETPTVVHFLNKLQEEEHEAMCMRHNMEAQVLLERVREEEEKAVKNGDDYDARFWRQVESYRL